jgi:hypothetical protein
MSVGLTQLIRSLALMLLIKNVGRHSRVEQSIREERRRVTSGGGVRLPDEPDSRRGWR